MRSGWVTGRAVMSSRLVEAIGRCSTFDSMRDDAAVAFSLSLVRDALPLSVEALLLLRRLDLLLGRRAGSWGSVVIGPGAYGLTGLFPSATGTGPSGLSLDRRPFRLPKGQTGMAMVAGGTAIPEREEVEACADVRRRGERRCLSSRGARWAEIGSWRSGALGHGARGGGSCDGSAGASWQRMQVQRAEA